MNKKKRDNTIIMIVYGIAVMIVTALLVSQSCETRIQNNIEAVSDYVTNKQADSLHYVIDSIQRVEYDDQFIILKQSRELEFADKAIKEALFGDSTNINMLKQVYNVKQ